MNTTPEQIDIQRNFVLKEFCEIVFKKIDSLILNFHTFENQLVDVDENFYRRVDLKQVVTYIKTELLKLGFVVEYFKLSWNTTRSFTMHFTIKTKNEIENEIETN